MRKPTKKLRVRITAIQTVTYVQIVEMTPKEWATFKELTPDEHVRYGGDLVGGWLDPRDIAQADDIGLNDFTAIVLDKNDKLTSDCYLRPK